jgi:hypothetical protein
MFLPKALLSFERQDALIALPINTVISVVHFNFFTVMITTTIVAAEERFRPARFSSSPSPLGFTSTGPANFTPVDSPIATSSIILYTSRLKE